ncbi:MAG: hypothetical protein LBD48_02105, partial [Treponema sp.]|nr:hypothetical protein [Treponema sp.]
MVAYLKKFLAPALLACVFFLFGCNVDPFGLFGSNDLAERWEKRNTFHFLTASERSLSLGDSFSFIVLCDTHI